MPSKKEQCKAIMLQYFGPATASLVDQMNEDEVIQKCRQKVVAMLGEEKAKVFDTIQ
jgi:monoamine oxidase